MKLEKTLVIGCQSYIGKQFYSVYRKIYPDTLGTHYKATDPSQKLDLLSPDICPLSLKKGEYRWAIIAAATTNLLRCEKEKGSAFRANVEGILHLVQALVEKEITPIILSSDYVFDGVFGGYTEESCKRPLNEYGRQKDQLEQLVAATCKGNYLIVRCSKIFGLNPGDNTLLDQIVRPLSQGQVVKAAFDQFFAPIHEADVIAAVLKLQSLDCRGLFNLCGSEVWNRLDLARAIGKILQVSESLIQPISLDDLPIPYQLPKHTYMDCSKFYRATDLKLVPLSHSLTQLEAAINFCFR